MSTVICKVCSKSAAKYKCPTCRIPFCSVSCSRTHKSLPCSVAPSSAPSAPLPTRSPALPLPAPTPLPPGLLSGAEAHPLTNEQRDCLVKSPEIRAAVADKELQELVRSVDGAKDPVDTLVSAMAGSDKFRFLADLVLSAVGEEGTGGGGRGEEKARAREELLRLIQS